MKVVILGGDGFCGWPTALHLSNAGHDVVIVDNLSRRNIDKELGCGSLTPIRTIAERLRTWKKISGRTIKFHNFDVARDHAPLLELLQRFQPHVTVHFAEQRSVGYSMKSPAHRRYTVDNNLNATHNLLAAIAESGLDIHVVHLGSVGVYGYETTDVRIPEGYLDVQIEAADGGLLEKQILFPANPGSIYHMTKAQDQLLFAFYNKNDGLRITDLHQGIVWGTQTQETELDERLINRFDYDADYGTVLNRFLMQAAIDYPLTVHGSGGQTRAFIHIQDTVRCIEIAIDNPPDRGDKVKIFNQITETYRVHDLARLVSEKTGVPVDYLPNPRNEPDENEFVISARSFLDLGLSPVLLSEGLMDEVTGIARQYAHHCDRSRIPCTLQWKKSAAAEDAPAQSEFPGTARGAALASKPRVDSNPAACAKGAQAQLPAHRAPRAKRARLPH